MMPADSTSTLAALPPDSLGMAYPARQTGAVLVISLILLMILTLLGLSSMKMTSLEEKMAANSQESIGALQSAESGLADALDNPGAIDLDKECFPAPPGKLSDYCTRTSFMMRPDTFQSCTYRLPSWSQYEPCVPLKMPSIHSS